MTIHDIKRLTSETEPCFFSPENMRFFGQTLQDFHVRKLPDGKYYIWAPSGPSERWRHKHVTRRIFDPLTNKLLMVRRNELSEDVLELINKWEAQ